MKPLWIALRFGLILFCAESFAEFHSLPAVIGPLLLGMRGGNEVGPEDYPQVVAVERVYEAFVNGAWVTQTMLCTASVFNYACVLFSAHCADRPGERTLTYNVITGRSTHRFVQQGNDLVRRDIAPHSQGKLTVSLGGIPSLEILKKYKAPTDEDILKVISEDLAVLKLDKPLTIENSFTEENLPSRPFSTVGKAVTGVGFGKWTTNLDVVTGKKEDVGEGQKRDGSVVVADQIVAAKPVLEVTPGTQSHLATPGDSGGPLLVDIVRPAEAPKDARRAIVAGVTSTINAEHAINGSQNHYVSTLHHREWIDATLAKLDCLSPQQRLAKIFPKLGTLATYEANLQRPAWAPGTRARQELESYVRDMLVAQGTLSPAYGAIELHTYPPDRTNGNYRFGWRAEYSKDRKVNQAMALDRQQRGESANPPVGSFIWPAG